MPYPPTPPDDPRPPGTVLLQDFMQPLGISAYRVAKDLSLAPITVSQILRGMRSISPLVACRLGAYFGVPPAYWLLVQASYEAHIAAKAGKANGTQVCQALQLNRDLHEGIKSKAMRTAFLGHNEEQQRANRPEISKATSGGGGGHMGAPGKGKSGKARLISKTK